MSDKIEWFIRPCFVNICKIFILYVLGSGMHVPSGGIKQMEEEKKGIVLYI